MTSTIESEYYEDSQRGRVQHNSIYHQKGRESDCNFTPSPVDNLRGMQRYLANYSINSSNDNFENCLDLVSTYLGRASSLPDMQALTDE